INGIGSSPFQTLAPNEAKRLVFTGERSTNLLQLQFRANGNGYYLDCTVWRAQVEKGNKVTDWQAAQEDVVSEAIANVGKWTKTYKVRTANPLPLTENNGDQLDDLFTYKVTAKTLNTGTDTTAI